ncbi:hypothetical protein JXM83_05045 [Candidatus Woesearchaeota archaeon]|nr:hypothetical protein [Candidatus Woesearchaeota archaeon]
MVVEFGEFKGNKVMSLKRSEEDRYGISFGIAKAKLIIENIDAIKQFIAENDKPSEE